MIDILDMEGQRLVLDKGKCIVKPPMDRVPDKIISHILTMGMDSEDEFLFDRYSVPRRMNRAGHRTVYGYGRKLYRPVLSTTMPDRTIHCIHLGQLRYGAALLRPYTVVRTEYG